MTPAWEPNQRGIKRFDMNLKHCQRRIAPIYSSIALQHFVALHCTGLPFRCVALRWIAMQTNVRRWVTGDPPAMQHCIVTLPCSIALQHGIAAVWLLACLLACLLVVALHSRPKFAGGSPVTLLQMQHCSATLQCSIALQHWMTTWDCNIALQNRTAACLCGTALQHCITALRSP